LVTEPDLSAVIDAVKEAEIVCDDEAKAAFPAANVASKPNVAEIDFEFDQLSVLYLMMVVDFVILDVSE
jgi:hypothetical protein